MCDTPQFRCQFSDCCYQSYAFNRMLQHTWDKHSLAPGFKFRCNIVIAPEHTKICSHLGGISRQFINGFTRFITMYQKKVTTLIQAT